MRLIILFLISFLWGQSWTDYLRSPVKWSVGLTNGYDNNVLRFSTVEKEEAALDRSVLGGSGTFDSHYARFFLTAFKNIQLSNREKEIQIFLKGNFSNYSQNKNRRYWSGHIKTIYRWGPYRRVEYSVSHLDSYYLRHYVNRDVSTGELAPCSFTDRAQRIRVSHPLKRRFWMSGSVGFTQRYFDVPFTEFDLDIFTSTLKFSKKFTGFGTVSLEGTYGIADNITFGKTANASDLDRSYHFVEWFIPVSYTQGLLMLDEVGFSIRRDLRQYNAEAVGDPLHSGRSHTEIKMDIWGQKIIVEKLTIKGTLRYRKRVTDSRFNWVSELKTFDQVQAWVTLEWDMIYDRY